MNLQPTERRIYELLIQGWSHEEIRRSVAVTPMGFKGLLSRLNHKLGFKRALYLAVTSNGNQGVKFMNAPHEGINRITLPHQNDTFYVSFDTESQPGKLEAVKVTVNLETITDLKRGLSINLCDHPLYRFLHKYCTANPPR